MLVGQFQTGINGIFEDDKPVLIGHDDPAETYIGFLALFQAGFGLIDVFLD